MDDFFNMVNNLDKFYPYLKVYPDNHIRLELIRTIYITAHRARNFLSLNQAEAYPT